MRLWKFRRAGIGLVLGALSLGLEAVEVAPRITDREIIEALAELKGGQKALESKMEERFKVLEAKMEQRMNALEAKFDGRFAVIEERFEAINDRFAAIDKRLSFLENLILILIASVLGLIGFVVWDRYTTLGPLDLRLRRIEEELAQDLELRGPGGSRLTRLVYALRELAKTDAKIAEVLKAFSLL